ncbi:hypothetical protein FG445_000844 [Yersinia enterocolitica]|nr:hypothetical protein [Yersinia enterocolitica]EKN3890934.1 hypothetical protein [Yersinia enterocolitica]EKN4795420.1 hypothetical protein [Yersinia enterocolitica]EKN5064928.1 hypothetical protein [Yersinia enterocolitica]
MTLIIATYNKNREIVFCGDALITGNLGLGNVKLLSSFRKIKNVPVNILKPDFGASGNIIRYDGMLQEHCCMIAFAGSTLVSQHIINNIEGHLKQLRFTYKEGQYKLEMICDNNKNVMDEFWSDNMFNQSPTEIFEYLTKDFQISVIEHSIYKAIEDFIKEKERYNKNFFDTQFIVGVSCHKSKTNHIFEIKMDFTDEPPKLIIKEINIGEIASVGISRYEYKLKEIFKDKSLSVDDAMLKFMCESVDDNEEVDLREIGYPVVLKKFDQFKEQRHMQNSKNKNTYS